MRFIQIPRAFTLLEMIVALAIVGVLVTLAIGAYRRVEAAGRATGCVSNLRQLGAALNLYLNDNNLVMPVLKAGRERRNEEVPVIDNTLDKYLPDQKCFACPGDWRLARLSGTSYHWNVALNGQALPSLKFFRTEQQSRIPVLGDKEGFHPYLENKVNVLYADGHASKDLKFSTGQ